MKCDVVHDSLVNGLRQAKLHSFVLDRPTENEVICEPEAVHYKKNESVLNTVKIYLEEDNDREIHFNNETLTVTLQLIKI